MNFDQAFEKLLGHEGGFVDHPDDPGGATNWGITERVARAHGYQGAMKDLPVDIAKAIYKSSYWTPIRAEELPAQIRYPLFDAAVNSGNLQAAVWLQRAVGADPDGVIGPKTIIAALAAQNEITLRKMLSQRLRFMTNLKTWPAFSRGWARRIAELLEE